MGFQLPPGFVAQPYGEVDDAGVAAIEEAQSPGTRMLVALTFPYRWPGFEWSADQADWVARNIAGLQPWSEPTKDGLIRVVVADTTEPIWWVCYVRGSPGWLIILGAIAVVMLLTPLVLKIAWTVLPEEARGGVEVIANLGPIIIMVLVMMITMTMTKALAPVAAEAVKERYER